jgi:hypothetical protein
LSQLRSRACHFGVSISEINLPCAKRRRHDMETEDKVEVEVEKIEVKKVEKILATATMVEY